MEVEAAKRSVTLAQKDAADARTKARRIERANDNWQAKVNYFSLLFQNRSKSFVKLTFNFLFYFYFLVRQDQITTSENQFNEEQNRLTFTFSY